MHKKKGGGGFSCEDLENWNSPYCMTSATLSYLARPQFSCRFQEYLALVTFAVLFLAGSKVISRGIENDLIGSSAEASRMHALPLWSVSIEMSARFEKNLLEMGKHTRSF